LLVPVASFAVAKPTEPVAYKSFAPPQSMTRPGPSSTSLTPQLPSRSSTVSARMSTTLDPNDPESDLASRRQEVSDLSAQFETLGPANDELRRKREAADVEFKSLVAEKNRIVIRISQARALYEAESLILADTQGMLERERGVLENSKREIEGMEGALTAMEAEKVRIAAALEDIGGEVRDSQMKVREYQTKGAELTAELGGLRGEEESAGKMLELNVKLLASAQGEYNNIREDMAMTERNIERERSKSASLANQIAVQTGVTARERERLIDGGKRLESVSMHNLTSTQNLAAAVAGSQNLASSANDAAKPNDPKPVDAFDSFFACQPKQSTPSVSSGASPVLIESDMASIRSVESVGKSPVAGGVKQAGVVRSTTPVPVSPPKPASVGLGTSPPKTVSTAALGTSPPKAKAVGAPKPVGVGNTSTTKTAVVAKVAAKTTFAASTAPKTQPSSAPTTSVSPVKTTITASAAAESLLSGGSPNQMKKAAVVGAKAVSSSNNDLFDGPPLPPQATKPNKGSTSELFTGGARSISPSKFDDAFNGFGAAAPVFDFDAAFKSTVDGAGVPGSSLTPAKKLATGMLGVNNV
jgi:hypothetical protein